MSQVGVDALTTQSGVSGLLLKSDAESVLTDEVFSNSGSFTDQGVDFINTASRKVKDYLNRELIVSEFNPLLTDRDWCKVDRTPDSDYPYKLRLTRIEEWPVLKVTEDTKLHGDRGIFAKDHTFSTIEYFAGYRREDQNLNSFDSNIQSNFNDKKGIPKLPAIIIDVTRRIAIHRSLRNLKGLIGIKEVEQKFGNFGGESIINDAKETYENKQLKRINSHRFLT